MRAIVPEGKLHPSTCICHVEIIKMQLADFRDAYAVIIRLCNSNDTFIYSWLKKRNS